MSGKSTLDLSGKALVRRELEKIQGVTRT
jgi:hypothetical protein